MKQYAFSRRSRLHLEKDFKSVFRDGLKTVSKGLVSWHICNAGKHVRIGLMVSKKTGGAVRRNRIKRLLREAARVCMGRFKEGLSIVIYPKPRCRIDNLDNARYELDSLAKKAGLYAGDTKS